MDGLIHAVYGPNPPAKTADVRQAANLATGLLHGRVSFWDIKTLADQLYAEPMLYSSHEFLSPPRIDAGSCGGANFGADAGFRLV
jgi:hypothetical protein